MKEEIERRRAEAAEKRQKVDDNVDGEDRPFKCVSPRGSSLKVSLFPKLRIRIPEHSMKHHRFGGAVIVLKCLDGSDYVLDRAPSPAKINGRHGDGTFNQLKSKSCSRPRQQQTPAR